MGKGMKWTPEESRDLAQAWIEVSEDKGNVNVKGTNQDSSEFWNSIVLKLETLAPVTCNGTHHKRDLQGITNHWREKVSRECKKFNRALAKVYACQPTGCGEEEKINMAVAIHLGKVDTMNYRMKSFEANTWKFYLAWEVLKDHRAFLPPRPITANDVVLELDDTNSGTEKGPTEGKDTEQNSTDKVTPTVLFKKPSPSSSDSSDGSTKPTQHTFNRGGASGKVASKKKADADELKKRKIDTLNEILNVQKQRREDFSQFIVNQTRVAAFNMANTMMEKALKLNDQMEAMNQFNIMKMITNGDTEADEIVGGN